MARIAIIGAGGRMGRQLVKEALSNTACHLTVATCRPTSDVKGVDVGKLINKPKTGIMVTDSLGDNISNTDVIVDFTNPETTLNLLALCQKHHKKMVIGTTGFTEEQTKQIKHASNTVPIVFAPNMSPGVNLMFKLLEIAATALGSKSDIEIIEKHHRNKLDAPSGTALEMGKIIAKTLHRSLEEHVVYTRHGREEQIRSHETIGFSTIRAGDIIGEHTALFATEGELLEITHKSSTRTHYAKGAIQAALWLNNQPEGLYSMMDVLNI